MEVMFCSHYSVNSVGKIFNICQTHNAKIDQNPLVESQRCHFEFVFLAKSEMVRTGMKCMQR